MLANKVRTKCCQDSRNLVGGFYALAYTSTYLSSGSVNKYDSFILYRLRSMMYLAAHRIGFLGLIAVVSIGITAGSSSSSITPVPASDSMQESFEGKQCRER